MKQYYIEIHYETGDSFKSYDQTSKLELRWNDLEVAKENLKRIKEYSEWYEYKHSSFHYKDNMPVVEKPDCVNDDYYTAINLLTDDNKKCQISAFWCGHFETLYYAKIKEDEDSDLIYKTRWWHDKD